MKTQNTTTGAGGISAAHFLAGTKQSLQHWAIIAPDLEGPAYGVGASEAEARQNAIKWGFGDEGITVKITAASYAKIEAGNPQAVEIIES